MGSYKGQIDVFINKNNNNNIINADLLELMDSM